MIGLSFRLPLEDVVSGSVGGVSTSTVFADEEAKEVRFGGRSATWFDFSSILPNRRLDRALMLLL